MNRARHDGQLTRSGMMAPVVQPSGFRSRFHVSDADIDPLGHASNLAYVRWIQEVAIAHSSHVGFDVDAYLRLGAVFVIVRHEVDYLRPALRGERIEARTWIASVMAAKCQRVTELVRVTDDEPGADATPGEQLLARGLTTWGFVDLATGRPRRIPDELKAAFGWPTVERVPRDRTMR